MLTVYWSDYFLYNRHLSFLSECSISNEKSLFETALRCFATFVGQYADCVALSVEMENNPLCVSDFIDNLRTAIKSVFGDITYGIISDCCSKGSVTVLISIKPVFSRHQYCDVAEHIAKAFECAGISVYPVEAVNGLKTPVTLFHVAVYSKSSEIAVASSSEQ